MLARPPILLNVAQRRDALDLLHSLPDSCAAPLPEKVDRNIHPHIKPVGLITRLIAAVTEPRDLVVDPAAGSFVSMHAACRLGREFTGCDLILPDQSRATAEVI